MKETAEIKTCTLPLNGRGLYSDPVEQLARRFSCRHNKRRILLLNSFDQILNGINFLFLKINLSTLLAHPGRNCVQRQVVTLTVNMERSRGAFHLALAVNTFHFFTLFRKSADHSWGSGREAVMIAR